MHRKKRHNPSVKRKISLSLLIKIAWHSQCIIFSELLQQFFGNIYPTVNAGRFHFFKKQPIKL